jgi:hypothetical protein
LLPICGKFTRALLAHQIFFYNLPFNLNILGPEIFEQKDTFFKKSLKIVKIIFFQIEKLSFVRN